MKINNSPSVVGYMKTTDYDPGAIGIVDKAAKLITPTGPVLKKIDADHLGVYDAAETSLKNIQANDVGLASLNGVALGYISVAQSTAALDNNYSVNNVIQALSAGSARYTRIGLKMQANNRCLKQASFQLMRNVNPTGAIYGRVRRVADDAIMYEEYICDASSLSAVSYTTKTITLAHADYVLFDEAMYILVETLGGDDTNYTKVGCDNAGACPAPDEYARYRTVYETYAWRPYILAQFAPIYSVGYHY